MRALRFSEPDPADRSLTLFGHPSIFQIYNSSCSDKEILTNTPREDSSSGYPLRAIDMIKVNLYKIKLSMKSEFGLKSFIDLKREFLDLCIFRIYENVWTSTLQEVAISEKEAAPTQSMLEKIYSFFNELSMDNQRISISVGDVIEIERWALAAEGSTMILNQTDFSALSNYHHRLISTQNRFFKFRSIWKSNSRTNLLFV